MGFGSIAFQVLRLTAGLQFRRIPASGADIFLVSVAGSEW